MKERGEELRLIEPPGGEFLPRLLLDNPCVNLVAPKNIQILSLGVVICASKPNERCAVRLARNDIVDEPTARADDNEVSDLRCF
jgi:hypothetical protein